MFPNRNPFLCFLVFTQQPDCAAVTLRQRCYSSPRSDTYRLWLGLAMYTSSHISRLSMRSSVTLRRQAFSTQQLLLLLPVTAGVPRNASVPSSPTALSTCPALVLHRLPRQPPRPQYPSVDVVLCRLSSSFTVGPMESVRGPCMRPDSLTLMSSCDRRHPIQE